MGATADMIRRRHSHEELAVLATGLCTPLGLTASSTYAEMAAGTVRFRETQVVDRAGQPVRASVLKLLEPPLGRPERMAALAATALEGCQRDITDGLSHPLPLVLAVPDSSEREGDAVVAAVLDALRSTASHLRLGLTTEEVVSAGRAGFFLALTRAAELLRQRRASRVLVGAVDSQCDERSLTLLARANRTLGRAQRDGLIPGEGAGFILVTSAAEVARRSLPVLGWILGCVLAEERHHFHQPEPNLAEGLTSAFAQLRCHPLTGGHRVDEVLSCQPGEHFWTRELQWAGLRNAALLPEPLKVSLLAATQGDTGAAAGVVGLGQSLYLTRTLAPPRSELPRVLVYGCSDRGQIGACIVEGDA
jgi:3-oxoacyl-[acyl-carrier-protein] synthase-1